MNVILIPARGGSKGLPKKNIIPLAGKPLIGWTILAAINSQVTDKVFVSTENDEIAEISERFGADIILRPANLALDNTSSDEVVQHAIEYLKQRFNHLETLLLLQPTSPLRGACHIREALELYRSKKADSVISVYEPEHTPVKAYIEREDGTLTGLFSPDAPYSRRQVLPRAFQPNGAIYIVSVACFCLNHQLPRENIYPYVMSIKDSIDIDTLEDLNKAEKFLKERNSG